MNRSGLKRKEDFLDIPSVQEEVRAGHKIPERCTEMTIETVFTAIAFAEAGELAYARKIMDSSSGGEHHSSEHCGDVCCCMRST